MNKEKTGLVEFLKWFFSLEKEEEEQSDPVDKFLDSVSMTAKSRFRAADRIGYYANIEWITNILFSMGLILIPLLQLANIKMRYSPQIVNAIMIFFSITVLIYSLVTWASRFDVRKLQLYQCGNALKDIIREVRAKRRQPEFDLDFFNKKYGDTIKDSENHNRSDFLKAKLESADKFKITGIKRLWIKLQIFRTYLPRLFFSILLLLSEGSLFLRTFDFSNLPK